MTYFANISRNDTIVYKTTSEGVTSATTGATLQDDDELFFEAEANSNYEIKMLAILSSSSTVPDFKWAFTTLTSARWMGGGHFRDQDSGGFSGLVTPSRSGNTTTLPNIQINSTPDLMYVYLDVSYVTAGTSGTVYFRWAQNTSSASSVGVGANSFMQVTKVGTNA